MSRGVVSPLRQRMLEDMINRQFGGHAQRDHLRQVRAFTASLCRSPTVPRRRIRSAPSSNWPGSA